MPVLEWSETARCDLLAIIDYISDDNPDAAQWLKDDIEVKALALPDHPKQYRVGRVPGTREMVVHSNLHRRLQGRPACGDSFARLARGPAMAARQRRRHHLSRAHFNVRLPPNPAPAGFVWGGVFLRRGAANAGRQAGAWA